MSTDGRDISLRLNHLIDNVFAPAAYVDPFFGAAQCHCPDKVLLKLTLDHIGINYEEVECDGLLEVILFVDNRNDGKLCPDSKKGHEPYFQFDPISEKFVSFGVNK